VHPNFGIQVYPNLIQIDSFIALPDSRHQARNFRRLVVRYERSHTIYEAFFNIACFMIVLRRPFGSLAKPRGCRCAARQGGEEGRDHFVLPGVQFALKRNHIAIVS
jgi:hypothetical protein